MKANSILLTASLIAAGGCLGAGYLFAGTWLIMPVLLAIFLFWYYARSRSVFGSASSWLLAIVLLAALGIAAGLDTMLMIAACSAALVSWDLIQFNQRLAENSLHESNPLYEKRHLQSLALAASAGLMLALISSMIHLRFPLVVILFLGLTTVGSLLFSMQSIMKKNRS